MERLVRELLLGPLAIGDVVQVDDDATDVGVVGEVDDASAQPHQVARSVLRAELGLEGLPTRRPATLEDGPGLFLVVGGDEREHVGADGGCVRVAEQRGQLR